MRHTVAVLGIPVDVLTPPQAVERLLAMLAEPRAHHVMTPNNEMLVHASRHASFAQLLRSTDLNLPDSTGVVWAMRRRGAAIGERVTGADTVVSLCERLGPEHPVFLLGGAPGVAEAAAETLRKSNPRLRIVGTLAGSPSPADAPAIVSTIAAASPHLLLVAYGAPRQDEWIAAHAKHLPSVRLAMGIGGTFDFLAGRRSRAPRWLGQLGLEWLWRLLQQPSRLPRILTAVCLFPLLVLADRADRHGGSRPIPPSTGRAGA